MDCMDSDCGSHIWIALSTKALNQLLPHHKAFIAAGTPTLPPTKPAEGTDKPTLMDITQLPPVTQPPGIYGLKLH